MPEDGQDPLGDELDKILDEGVDAPVVNAMVGKCLKSLRETGPQCGWVMTEDGRRVEPHVAVREILLRRLKARLIEKALEMLDKEKGP